MLKNTDRIFSCSICFSWRSFNYCRRSMSGIFLSLSSIKHSFSPLLVLFRFSSNKKKKKKNLQQRKRTRRGKKERLWELQIEKECKRRQVDMKTKDKEVEQDKDALF